MKRDATAPVAIELFTVEITLGQYQDNIKKPLKEAYGGNVKRQVVDFM